MPYRASPPASATTSSKRHRDSHLVESAAVSQGVDSVLEKPGAQGNEEVRDDDERQAGQKGAPVGLEVRQKRTKLVHKTG